MARDSKAAAYEIAGACLAVRMRAVNRAVTNIYDGALRPLGVKASQLNVLVAIAAAGKAQPVHLARALHLEKSTFSRNVDKMKNRGWIRSRDAGTGVELSLTSQGSALLKKALPAWRRAQADAEKLLGDTGVAAIHTMHGSLSTS